MKRIHLLLSLFCATLVLTTGCQKKNALEILADECNKSLPIETIMGTITQATIEDNCFIYHTMLNEDQYTAELWEQLPGTSISSLSLVLAKNPSSMQFVRELAKQGASIGYRYLGTKSGYSFTRILNPNDIIALAEDPEQVKASLRESLVSNLAQIDANCPNQMDNSTVMDAVKIEEDLVHYYYTLDETLISMDNLEQYARVVEVNLVNIFTTSTDVSIQEDVATFCELGLKYGFTYQGSLNPDHHFTIIFNPSDKESSIEY